MLPTPSNTNGIDPEAAFTCLRQTRLESPALSPYNTCLDDCRPRWTETLLRRLLPASRVRTPLIDGLRFFLRRNDFDVIITEDYRAAVLFGLLTRIFGGRSRHVIKELYLAENALTTRWKRTLFRIALKRADCVIVNATSERAAYANFLNLPIDRVVFLPWPSNIPVRSEAELQDHSYIFAAGRSMRDWKTLFTAAASLPIPFVIVASRPDIAALTIPTLSIPTNVTVHCDIDRSRYLQLLADAHLVILPLTKTLRSTGQAVALEAMAMRKPLICADTPGIADYITDEENGLFYIAENPASLIRQIERLRAAPDLRKNLADAGALRIETLFNKNHYREALKSLMIRLVHPPTCISQKPGPQTPITPLEQHPEREPVARPAPVPERVHRPSKESPSAST